MCIHYDEPAGAPPPPERYRGAAQFGRWRIMAKRIDDLYVSAIFWSYYSRTILSSTADLEHFQNGLDRLC